MESPASGTEFKGKQPQEYIRMEAVATFVKVSFPRYLARLPVPKTFSGIAKLSGEDWIHLFPFMLTIGFILYAVVRLFHPAVESRKKSRPINDIIKKDSPKVATLVDVEDLDKEKVAYCRCWKSTKFPLCDGTHNAHNEESGDNVGPLVIKKKKL